MDRRAFITLVGGGRPRSTAHGGAARAPSRDVMNLARLLSLRRDAEWNTPSMKAK
jgi:hypothetical protein